MSDSEDDSTDINIDEEDVQRSEAHLFLDNGQILPSGILRDPKYFDDRLTVWDLKRMPQNLKELALWAFGPRGISSLQVLAYGDYSFSGRFQDEYHTLVRQSWADPFMPGVKALPFRPLRSSDAKMKEIIQENMDFLSTCPTDTLVISGG